MYSSNFHTSTLNNIRRFFSVCLLAIFFSSQVQAQTATACFEAKDNITRGCAPFTVQLTDCSGAATIFYNYGDGSAQTTNSSHTYTTPGLYTVTQFAQNAGDAQADALERVNFIEVLPSPQPVFDVKLCSNNEVFLSIPDQNYEQYVINWGDGLIDTVNRGTTNIFPHRYNFAPVTITVTGNYNPGNCGGSNAVIVDPIANIIGARIQSLNTINSDPANGSIQIAFTTNSNFQYEIAQKASNETNFTTIRTITNATGDIITENIQNLNTQNLTYCYTIITKDLCGNSVNSDTLCNLRLTAEAQNNQNVVQWTPYGGSNFQQYILYRNEVPLTTINDINTATYTDTSVTCTEQYCYSIQATVGTTTTFTSTSNTDCAIAFSQDIPPTITVFNSTVDEDKRIRVFWTIETFPKITEYLVTRTDNTLRLTTSELEALDVNLDVDNQQYFYEIFYTNQCGNSSDKSLITSPVLLTTQQETATRIVLNWSRYRNAENSFENYELEKLEADGTVYQTIPLTTDTLYTDTDQDLQRQVLRYRIKTNINSTTGLVSYSNVLEVERRFRIFVPNAFTPNGDGLNDTFEPKAIFVQSYNMVVYNRLGKVVFQSKEITQGWDGTFNGKEASSDVYVYTIELVDTQGNEFKTKGTFTLIR